MRNSLVEYVRNMSNDDYDILTEIIDRKYRKFIKLYFLLEEYSEDIKSLDYHQTEDNLLKIDLKVSKGSIKDLFEMLTSNNNNENILISSHKSYIHIEIYEDEAITA